MTNATPFLGVTASDLDFDLTIAQDLLGMFGGMREHHFTPATTPQLLHCRNVRCKQGGFRGREVRLLRISGA